MIVWTTVLLTFSLAPCFWAFLAAYPQVDNRDTIHGKSRESGEEQLDEETLGNGLPVSPGYIQLVSDVEGGYVSAPGCPELVSQIQAFRIIPIWSVRSLHGYPWVQFGDPAYCFLVGERGPCNEGMEMGFRRNVSLPGYCKCEGCTDKPSGDEDVGHCPVWKDRGGGIRKRVGHYKEQDRCYELFTRGPCRGGQIFSVEDLNSAPTCSESRCKVRRTSRDFGYPNGRPQVFDPSTNACLTLGETCIPSDDGDHSVYEYEYAWNSSYVIPVCQKRSFELASVTKSLDGSSCPGGRLYSRSLGRCVRPLLASSIVG